jgi:hypothetical protein
VEKGLVKYWKGGVGSMWFGRHTISISMDIWCPFASAHFSCAIGRTRLDWGEKS